jgi:hypothetical protein
VRVVQLEKEEKGGGLPRPAGVVKLVPVTETWLTLTEGGWLPIPSSPTKEQIAGALRVLCQPLAEFRFVSPAARSVMLAAILTAMW